MGDCPGTTGEGGGAGPGITAGSRKRHIVAVVRNHRKMGDCPEATGAAGRSGAGGYGGFGKTPDYGVFSKPSRNGQLRREGRSGWRGGAGGVARRSGGHAFIGRAYHVLRAS